MYAQHIVEFVYKFLWEQGRSSMDGASCSYKNEYGEKCAVGCLIDPIDYSEAMEGNPVVTIVKAFPSLPSWMKENITLLRQLQRIHDSDELTHIQNDPDKFRRVLFAKFDIFCEHFGYDATFLDLYRK